MILEGSHKHDRLRLSYGAQRRRRLLHQPRRHADDGQAAASAALTFNPVRLRERLGGRWLTADFRAGDLLTFSMYTVHCSLDNHSDQIRLSSDTRYQLASEPVDERWVGEQPIGHGDAARREQDLLTKETPMKDQVTPEQVASYQENGFLVIENFLDADEMAHWSRTTDEAVAAASGRRPSAARA